MVVLGFSLFPAGLQLHGYQLSSMTWSAYFDSMTYQSLMDMGQLGATANPNWFLAVKWLFVPILNQAAWNWGMMMMHKYSQQQEKEEQEEVMLCVFWLKQAFWLVCQQSSPFWSSSAKTCMQSWCWERCKKMEIYNKTVKWKEHVFKNAFIAMILVRHDDGQNIFWQDGGDIRFAFRSLYDRKNESRASSFCGRTL